MGTWEIKVIKFKNKEANCGQVLGTNVETKFGLPTVQDDHRAISIKAARWCNLVLILTTEIKQTFVI